MRQDTNESQFGDAECLAREARGAAQLGKRRRSSTARARDRSTSKKVRKTPTEPIARLSHGSGGGTRVSYQPEPAVDVETGAIVAATIDFADRCDAATSATTVMALMGTPEETGLPCREFTAIADKRYGAETS